MRDVQRLRLHAIGSKRCEHRRHGLGRTGNHQVVRAIERRDVDAILQRRLDARGIGKDRRHRAACRKRLHQAPPGGNQLQPILERARTGNAGRGVFADAMAHDRGRNRPPRLPERCQQV